MLWPHVLPALLVAMRVRTRMRYACCLPLSAVMELGPGAAIDQRENLLCQIAIGLRQFADEVEMIEA